MAHSWKRATACAANASKNVPPMVDFAHASLAPFSNPTASVDGNNSASRS
jgi:hypothetical protein